MKGDREFVGTLRGFDDYVNAVSFLFGGCVIWGKEIIAYTPLPTPIPILTT